MDNLVNVVVGAVVDASVCVIVLFANLDVIFKANLFHLDFFSITSDALLSQGRQSTPKLTLHLILSCGVVLKVIVISMLRAY